MIDVIFLWLENDVTKFKKRPSRPHFPPTHPVLLDAGTILVAALFKSFYFTKEAKQQALSLHRQDFHRQKFSLSSLPPS